MSISSVSAQITILNNAVKSKQLWPAVPNLILHIDEDIKTLKSMATQLPEEQQTQLFNISLQFEKSVKNWKEVKKRSTQSWGAYFASFISKPEETAMPGTDTSLKAATIYPIFMQLAPLVEAKNTTEGLYRIGGSLNMINSTLEMYQQYPLSPIPADLTNDIHTVTGMIKALFREMQPPLLEEIGDELLAIDLEIDTAVASCKAAIDTLSPPNRRLLIALLNHLNRLSKVGENKMNAMNLGICFAPNILPSLDTLAQSTELIKFLIEHASELA